VTLRVRLARLATQPQLHNVLPPELRSRSHRRCPRNSSGPASLRRRSARHKNAVAGSFTKDRQEALASGHLPTVQPPARIAEGIDVHLAAMRALAHRLYDVWGAALRD
jgi:hypothetical protein